MSTVTERLPLLELPIGQEQKRSLGVLNVQRETGSSPLPLCGVDIKAHVADRVASVTVTQKFRNTYAEHLEAVYIFPLDGGCVVSDFEMRVGDRIIKGIVQERAEARAQYQQAIKEGKRAALLEQERDDVFTMQVGNIPPNEEITVITTYSERLPFFENGKTELRLPLVVAPRYIPGGTVNRNLTGQGTASDTDVVADASRITPPRLADGFDPRVDLTISAQIEQTDASGSKGLSDLSCSQHATQISLEDGAVSVSLAKENERLNRDFVLQWRLSSAQVKSSLLVYRNQAGEAYGMLSIMPPKRDGFLGAPRDVLFLVDRSGSMEGIKMTSAARACSVLLNTLGPSDRFAIAAFDNSVEWFSDRGVLYFNADEVGVQNGEKYLRGITARGGTELDMALDKSFQALSLRPQAQGRIPVLVVLTDGEVGDESRILKRVQQQIGDARVFTIGIDTAVNSGLLKRLADLGGGTATFVAPGTSLENALASVGREIGNPIVTDISVTADGALSLGDASPSRVPDLFDGRAVTTFFRMNGKGSVRVRGRNSDGSHYEELVKCKEIALPAISQLWAKAHISDLEDSYRTHPSHQIKSNIIKIAVGHSLLTKFTAFIVVDQSEVVNQDGTLRTIVQPVESPEGWAADNSVVNVTRQAMSAPGAPMMRMKLAQVSSPDQVRSRAKSEAALDEASSFSATGSHPRQESESLMGSIARSSRADASNEAVSQKRKAAPSQAKKDSGAASEPESPPIDSAWGAPPAPASAPSVYASEADDSWGAPAGGAMAPLEAQAPPENQAPLPPPGGPAQPASPQPSSALTPPSTGGWGAPSMSPPPPAPRKPEGLLGKVRDLADNLMESVTRKNDDQDRKAAIQMIQKLKEILEAIHSEIKSGRVPDGSQLDNLRRDVIKFLSHSECGTEVPALQKFLRGNAVELVESLKQQGVTATNLQPIWQRHMEAFNQAYADATNQLTGVDGGDRFWEASV